MSFEFTENVMLVLPDASDRVKQIVEADKGKRNKVITEIAAIHAGLTSNYNMYTEEALTASQLTWTDPYPKPIIINHDELSDPLGRVMGAKMMKEADGTPYLAIQAAIIDPNAVERVLDERYITGSVGGKANHAYCSICNVDWATAEMAPNKLPCRHRKGRVYEGKLAYLELGDISWREYSFVNIPADKKSKLTSVTDALSAEDDGWVRGVKLYSLDMTQESILDLNEDKPHNVLQEMKKVDAVFTYQNLKGTFLTTTAFDFARMLEKENDEKITFIQNDTTIESETVENDHIVASEEKENMPTNDEVIEQDDDILAVAENLRAENDSEDSEVSANEDENSTEDNTEESAEGSATETDSVENSDDAPTAPEETDADKAPVAEETEDAKPENEEATKADENEDQNLVGSDDAVSDSPKENSDEKSEDEKSNDDSALVELQAQVEKLTEENSKLKKHLHYMLAERVVDAKIAVGLVNADERADALKEHEGRTASSLADALKDAQRMPAAARSTKPSTDLLNDRSQVVEGEKQAVTDGETDHKVPELSMEQRLENLMTETLMGRRSL